MSLFLAWSGLAAALAPAADDPAREGLEGMLTRVDAAPEKGFLYPYYLFLPPSAVSNKSAYLLVQPNNTGSPNDDLNVHDEDAKYVAGKASLGNAVSRKLGFPLLVPVFPRPEKAWKIYTHALDRDTIWARDADMKRLDLQLLAMIVDCRARLEKTGLFVHVRVLMTGFSAAGTFVNRFAMLHPDTVAALAIGGVNGIVMLPLSELGGQALNYPLGIADYAQVIGHAFSVAAYKRIPQFIFMGENDTNDATLFKDGYDEEERDIVHAVIGKAMLPDRFKKCEQIYRDQGLPARFVIYPGLGHRANPQVLADIFEFFKIETAEKRS